jgi:hypothetical protein
MTPDEMWNEIQKHDAWFINKAQQAVELELGDESSSGAFSNRVVAKVLAALPQPGGGSIDYDLLASKVADKLAQRLAQ